ncbi:hypothetical protein Lal_00000539 [Lupinus albus]|nr:hypothetical protein Lal_00000539 [Lupinus albus]
MYSTTGMMTYKYLTFSYVYLNQFHHLPCHTQRLSAPGEKLLLEKQGTCKSPGLLQTGLKDTTVLCVVKAASEVEHLLVMLLKHKQQTHRA